MNNNLLSVNNAQLSHSNPDLDLMGNPGSNLDLASLYKNGGVNISMPNVPASMTSSTPMRTAPTPPAPTAAGIALTTPAGIAPTPLAGIAPKPPVNGFMPEIVVTPSEGKISCDYYTLWGFKNAETNSIFKA